MERVGRESQQALGEGRKVDQSGWKKWAPGIGIITDKLSGEKTYSAGGIRRSLGELAEAMRSQGVSEERISEILRPGREIAFSKQLDTRERSDQFEAMYERLLSATQQEMRVQMDLSPDASRYFQAMNAPNTAYIAGGKNSQYTIPAPPIRGR